MPVTIISGLTGNDGISEYAGISPFDGIVNNSGGSIAVSADWANWDGTTDGAVTNLFAVSGTTGSQDIAAVSDTEAVLFWEGNTTGKCVVLDVSANLTFKNEATNTLVETSNKAPIGLNIVRLTTTKYLTLAEDNTVAASSTLNTSLITKSGKTLTETDYADTGVTAAAQQFRNSLCRLNDTQGVFVGRESTDSNQGRVGIIDITGDEITIGTLVDLNNVIGDYPSVCRLTDSSFMVIDQNQVHYCTVSGTTITLVSSINTVLAGTTFDDTMIGRIDNDTALATYEINASSIVYANTFSWNGSAIVRGTEVSDIFPGNNLFQATGTVTELGDRQVMFSGRQDDETPQFGAAVVLSVDESNVITVGTRITTFPSIQADHDVVDATPSGLYVFGCCQDETTTPIQQIGTRIMKGF